MSQSMIVILISFIVLISEHVLASGKVCNLRTVQFYDVVDRSPPYRYTTIDYEAANTFITYAFISYSNTSAEVQTEAGCRSYLASVMSRSMCGVHLSGKATNVRVFGTLEDAGVYSGPKKVDLKNLLSTSDFNVLVNASTCPERITNVTFDVCKSTDSLCVLANAPLLRQNSSLLHPVISRLANDPSIKADTGWCAPVAGTMSLAGLALDNRGINNSIYPAAQFKNVSSNNVNTSYNIDTLTQAYGENIYTNGQLMNTFWGGGGTMGVSILGAYVTFNHSSIPVSNEAGFVDIMSGEIKFSAEKNLNSSVLFALIQKNKPAAQIYVTAFQEKDSTFSEISGTGHAISLNGYEDGRLKLYDPWGRIYNVTAESVTLGKLGTRIVLQHTTGQTGGYVSSFNLSKRLVILGLVSYVYAKNINYTCEYMIGGNTAKLQSACQSDVLKNGWNFKKRLKVAYCDNTNLKNWNSRLWTIENNVRTDYADLASMCQAFGFEFKGRK